MCWLSNLLFYARTLFAKQRLDTQLNEEVQTHVELATEANVAKGMTPREARFAALREFGNLAGAQERTREERGWILLDLAWKDFRFALRGLHKSPGFTVVAIATIAIAIGAGTSVFSLVNAILLQSLPVPNPQELRSVRWRASEVAMRSYNGHYGRDDGNIKVRESFNHPTFSAMRERAEGMADVFGYFPVENETVLTGNGAIVVDGLVVSDNFFSGLKVGAHIGRVFARGDETAARPEIVLTHRFWQRQFDGNPNVLGQLVSIKGVHLTIVGILPDQFPGIIPGAEFEFYTLLSANSPFLYVALSEDWHWFVRVMARLHPGNGDTALASALTPIFANADPGRMKPQGIELASAEGGLEFDRDTYGRPLAIMLGITALVMLIACFNLTGLSLSRGATREHELAVRAALGAGRRRLIAQTLIENTLLAAAGGGLGIVLAISGRKVLSRLLSGSADGLDYDLSLDARVLGFSLAAIAATSLLVGLIPALRAGRVDPLDGLKSRGVTGKPRTKLGRFLVAGQICVSLSILGVAGLGMRSVLNLQKINTGFQTDNLYLFSLNPSSAGYDNLGLVDFHDRTQEAIAAVPGIENTTVTAYAHLSEQRSAGGFEFADKPLPPGERNWTRRQSVSHTFFETMGIPIVEGRGIRESDAIDAPKVVVVNETYARTVSPDRSPVGRTFNMWSADWRIVGVCADAKMAHLTEDIPATTFFAFPQRFYDRFSMGEVTYSVRSALPAAAVRSAVDRAVAAVNPDVPATDFLAQTVLLNQNIGRERMLANLCLALSGVALLLCCIGLYGLISYDVARRKREIAVRMAIGAQARDVAGPIVREALVLTVIGILGGAPIFFGMTKVIQNQLHGVKPFDPLTVATVLAILLVVALVAVLLPACRAVRVDPINALRNE